MENDVIVGEGIRDRDLTARAAAHEDIAVRVETATSDRPLHRGIIDLSAEERSLLAEDLKAGTMSAPELATKYRLKDATIVQSFKSRLGLTKPHAARVHPDLDARIAEKKHELAELEAAKAATAIRFEWAEDSPICSRGVSGAINVFTDGILIVHGFTKSFLGAEGFVKLRQFFEKEFPDHDRARSTEAGIGPCGVER